MHEGVRAPGQACGRRGLLLGFLHPTDSRLGPSPPPRSTWARGLLGDDAPATYRQALAWCGLAVPGAWSPRGVRASDSEEELHAPTARGQSPANHGKPTPGPACETTSY